MIKYTAFSRKQKQVLSWWQHEKYKNYDGIICDGAVRAGKTVIMSLSFVFWSMSEYQGQQFALCGKTIGSLRRNVITNLKTMLHARGFIVSDHRSENRLEITFNGNTNNYYLFGGKDESSQDLIQGITLAGVFFDEVALMPESFVSQALARMSVSKSKAWFNCNPNSPYHWFKLDFIDQKEQKKYLHIHFLMQDNPSLSQEIIDRYERNFTGVFYQRYILGLWVLSEGLIYDNFDKETMVISDLPSNQYFYESYVAIDYGTLNPTTFKLWQRPTTNKMYWVNTDEYYYSGRDKGRQKTDEEYLQDLIAFCAKHELRPQDTRLIIDPSAASFIALTRKNGFNVQKAKNDVLDGIRFMAQCLNQGFIKYTQKCTNTFREFSSYVWDDKASEHGEDKPIKQHDHCLDADRYFCYTVLNTKNNTIIKRKPSYMRG